MSSTALEADNTLQSLNNLTELMRTEGKTEHCTAQDVGRNPTESLNQT